jgi:hypothetical protein
MKLVIEDSKDTKKYNEFIRDKKNLLATLLLYMDREVRDRVKAHAEYANEFNYYNIFTIICGILHDKWHSDKVLYQYMLR